MTCCVTQMWHDSPGDGLSVIRKVYDDRPLGVYPYPCGRRATSLDLDNVLRTSDNTFPIASGATSAVQQSLAFRPIFDESESLSVRHVRSNELCMYNTCTYMYIHKSYMQAT